MGHPTRPGNRLSHHGKGGELFVIFIVNLLLKILTLGIYHFWARTRVRRYLWTQTAFDGERFQYTGTGLELFLGALEALLIFVIIGTSIFLLALIDPRLAAAGILAAYLFVGVLIGAAVYGAQRYKLTRTRLRGIRFGLSGSAWRYGWANLGYYLLTALTLGLAAPMKRIRLTGRLLSNTRYGSERFRFDGRARDVFGRYLVCWLLALPTLGISLIWYLAAEYRYIASRLSLGGLSFRFHASGGQLFLLVLTNLLLLAVTLGLAFPWVLVRNARFMMSRMQVDGRLDYDGVRQTQPQADAVGEGFAEALQLGGI